MLILSLLKHEQEVGDNEHGTEHNVSFQETFDVVPGLPDKRRC